MRLQPGTKAKKRRKPAKASPSHPAVAKLAVALREYKEAVEQQAATAEILRVISQSRHDVQPVFDAILESATKLCDAHLGILNLYDGENLRTVARKGGNPAFAKWVFQRGLYKPVGTMKRVLVEKRPVQLADLRQAPAFLSGMVHAVKFVELAGARTYVAVPLVKDGRALGAFAIYRREVRLFTKEQIRLVESFAAQAVIAIENARLFNETKEALERQTATSEVLKTISRSTFDLDAVLKVLIENATRLAGASQGFIFRFDGSVARLSFSHNAPPAYTALIEANPIQPGRGSLVGRVLLEKKAIHIPDVLADKDFTWHEAQRLGGFRSMFGVPMLRQGEVIGVIAMWSDRVSPFSDRQRELVSTFADQAVIAIENVRLFNETREALERQTATADILRVISSTPTDTQPVFDAIVAATQRLIAGRRAGLFLRQGSRFVMAGNSGMKVEDLPEQERNVALDREKNFPSRAILDGKVVHVTDWAGDEVPEYERLVAKAHGIKSGLIVPLLRKGEGIGALAVVRETAGPYDEKEIALLRSFADQAVIAIENVRLFNETKEALERQTATAEILQVIGSSPTDTQPVFDAIVNSGLRLFPGAMITVARPDGGTVRAAAIAHEDTTMVAGWRERFTTPLSRDRLHAAAILDAKLIDFPDAQAEKDGPLGPGVRNFLLSGNRGVTIMPMLRGEGAIGAISVTRAVPGPLSDKQIAILRTFADQAVIAIENVRLFNELQTRNKDLTEALEQQTATGEILKVISATHTDVQPVFETIIRNAVKLCDGAFGTMFTLDGGMMDIGAQHNTVGELAAVFRRGYPYPANTDTPSGRAIVEHAVVNLADILDAHYSDAVKQRARIGGYRAVLTIPLMRGETPVGALAVAKKQTGAFPDSYVSLLKTFADQAVIAIENVRLFNELEARNKDLGESLDQQKASGEILATISSSIADAQPVFDKIVESCARLFEGYYVGIGVIKDDDLLHAVAYHGPNRREFEAAFPIPVDENSATGRAIAAREVMHYPDVFGGKDVPANLRRSAEKVGGRSVTVAPMLWEGRGVGGIFLARDFAAPYSEKEIRQLKTFADQAVIAIQNARLFREIAEKSAQLEVANKHKSDFLANMSHELRTPLNAIIGFSEVLSERMFGEVNEKQADYLKDIHESGKHLLSLINDILDLSKIEAGRMDLEVSSFHLPSAISNAMTLVRERAQRHGVQLGAEVDERLGELQADERKVKQILLNLLSNAVKFTPEGGRVDVSAKLDTDKVEIAVKDSGVGISAEDQARLFEEFRQVGSDAARKAEGTGLGLALTKKFVELHGGEIRVDSAPGKGSVFSFTLPLR